MMGGHSSVMLNRLMNCHLPYHSIPHIIILLGGHPTHLTHSVYLCSVPSVERTNVQLR